MASPSLPPSARTKTLADIATSTFDYILIGGGTSGCLLASRLAGAPSKPSVLLVEAGGEDTDDPENLIPGLVVPKFGNAAGNWLYETLPQKELNDRTLVYPRGRGMGGSSAVNFSAWTRGPICDWEAWAERVGDEWWRWESVVEVMKGFEVFRPEVPKGMEGYVKPTEGMHQVGGPIAVGTGRVWQGLIGDCLQAATEAGFEVNRDHNDGEILGCAVAQMNVDQGVRRSSAAAFLGPVVRENLGNLVVVTRTICKRLLFDENRRAFGVELLPATPTADSPEIPTSIRCAKEVVLCAGTFETPHILLLSCIGPADELKKHNIPIILDAPGVGANVRDHSAFSIEATIDPSIVGHNQLLKNPEALAAARKEYIATQTGPLAVFGASATMLFTKVPALYTSPEFHALPPETQTFLAEPKRPSTEIWMHGGPLFYTGRVEPTDSIIAIEGLCQNLLSKGSVTLRNTDTRDLPLIDPAYCTEAYDWRVAIETIKIQLRIASTPAMKAIIRKPLHGPGQRDADGNLTLCSEDDEEAIKQFLREELTQGFHSLGSCVMGSEANKERVVDANFQVIGTEGLRIADMSVCPILTNNHTQINAYLIAERCAQVMLGSA